MEESLKINLCRDSWIPPSKGLKLHSGLNFILEKYKSHFIIPKFNALSNDEVQNCIQVSLLGDFGTFWAVPKNNPKGCEMENWIPQGCSCDTENSKYVPESSLNCLSHVMFNYFSFPPKIGFLSSFVNLPRSATLWWPIMLGKL